MTTQPHITVIGAGYAGLMALQRLRMQRPETRLTLVEPRNAFQHRIRLHEVAVGAPGGELPLAPLCDRLGVEHMRQRAVAVRGTGVQLESGEALDSQAVLLAMGSRTRPPPGPAYVMDDADGARVLHHALLERPDARVTVIGGGPTGLEVATRIAARLPASRVTLWRSGTGWGLTPRGDAHVDDRLVACGVEVVHDTVRTLTETAACGDRHELGHDVAVWCGGFSACPIPVDGRRFGGRIPVDPFLRVTPGVFAAGDVCAPPGPGGIARMGCVTAMPTGAHAAGNVLRALDGAPLAPFRFRDVVACIALDPGHGVLQRLAEDGTPHGVAVGGRAGGLAKAAILAMVGGTYALERALGRPVYHWAGPANPPLTREPA